MPRPLNHTLHALQHPPGDSTLLESERARCTSSPPFKHQGRCNTSRAARFTSPLYLFLTHTELVASVVPYYRPKLATSRALRRPAPRPVSEVATPSRTKRTFAYHGAVAPLPSSAICTSACSYTSFVRAQQQVKRRIVWVRLTTGSGSLGSSSVISSSGIALFDIMLEAPGDVATLCRGAIRNCASTLVGLVETDLRVSIGGHMLEDNDSIDEYGAERDAPFDVHLAAERATEQVHGPRPDLQSAPRDSRVCSPLTNCHAPNARRLSEVIIAGQNRRHGRRSRSGSRRLCGSPARRLRESLQMDSASRGGCRLAARQTVGASLFSPPPRRRGVAGSMARAAHRQHVAEISRARGLRTHKNGRS